MAVREVFALPLRVLEFHLELCLRTPRNTTKLID